MTARRPEGFTLLEMIVVLMIAGMAVALGFQSLGQWRRAEAAIAGAGSTTREGMLTRQWLDDSLRGLVAVESPAFSGQRDVLSGTSLAPVMSGQGGMTPMEWRLDSTATGAWLVLTESGKTMRLPLPAGAAAHFSYLDQEGKSHDQWPPALGLHDQLPAAIALSLDAGDPDGQVWLAAIAGSRNPQMQPYEASFD